MKIFSLSTTMPGLLCLALAATSIGQTAQSQNSDLVESRELNSRVVQLYREHKYDEALSLAKRALDLREKALGTEHQDLIPVLINLGEVYRAKQKLSEAQSSYERALQIGEKAFGAEDPKIAQSAFGLAELYRLQALYTKAEPLYQRVIRIREKTGGTDKSELIAALESYVASLLAQGKTQESAGVEKRLSELLAEKGIIQGGVLNGRALKLVTPAYPALARSNHASGVVQVRVLIDENGNVIKADAIRSGAIHLALAAAAEDAARQAKFTPTLLSGKPVKVYGIIIYRFIAQ